MRLSASRRVQRRDLLRVLGGAALALPGLELFQGESRAQTNGSRSKFIVFCYAPDGVNQNAFWPTGTTNDFTLSPTLAHFEPFKDKLLVLGPIMEGSRARNGSGLSYNTLPPQHQAPVTLAARIGTNGCTDVSCTNGGLPYVQQEAAVNRIDGPSIDQVIANAVQADSTFGSLNFGLHPIGGDTPSDINYQQDGAPLRRLSSADDAWRYVFGDTTGAMTPVKSSSAAAKHAAVTDFLHSRFADLRPALSTTDRERLDGHLSALRSYEQRLEERLNGEALSAECANPMRAMVATDPDAIRTGADTETLSPFFMDIISTAFACNLTKVASVTFGYPGGGDAGGLRMPWLGFNDPLHFVSHHGNGQDKLNKYQQMNAWIAGQVAGLMERLAALPATSGNGTLLDETTIYWFNRHGDGDSHTNFALPNVILGGTGGYFEMGRWLQLPTTNPTQVLISLAHAMGVEVDRFGQDIFADTSPLAGLT